MVRMKRGNPLLERIRLECCWQKANLRLAALRHGQRCAAAIQRREGPLLELLDSAEFELGQLDFADGKHRETPTTVL